ncbi:hypothetical protein [Couchioplanes azureus]|uniref:hypothetical protein n=1 Tax=Couchioplanes caeruleus TaxID=56438 RepID=UPI0016703109|nr:hypothetical protein [Couchioplanes caeruleus]GGQ67173.1 hypothetical protein GCM10010166_41270 [Couchioplanes caeruleus subsp. azureus]
MQEHTDGSSSDASSARSTVTLRELLTRALRKQGFGEVCKVEPGTSNRLADSLSQNLLFSMLLGFLLFASFRLGWDFWITALVIFASMLGLVLAVRAGGCTNMLGYLAYMAAWITLGVYLFANGDYSTLFLTHLLPFLLVIGTRWAVRAVRFTAHVPFFVPITLLLILMPLISEDPWRIAVAAEWRIGLLAAITLTPLSLYLLVRMARLDSTTLLFKTIDTLNDRDVPMEAVWKRIDKHRNKPAEHIDADAAIVQLAEALNAEKEITTARLVKAVMLIEKRFRRLASIRVMSVVGGVWIAVTGLLYALALTIMPTSLAADWSKSQVETLDAEFFAWDFSIVTSPYLQVALLLGTVAAVGFAGFVLTEEQYFEGFTKGVIGKPVEQYLMLALPYLAVADEDPNEPSKSES